MHQRCGSLLPDKVDNKIKILLLTILFGCDHVGQKTFESSLGWFELNYPEHWTQSVEDDGAYLFMDNKDWKGNLRITAMRLEDEKAQQQPERLKKNLKDELERKPNSRLIKLGDKDAVYWEKEVEQDGDSLMVYNWTTGDNGTLLICSFAIDKDRIDEKEVKEELEFAIGTLKSIGVK